jgi:GTP pyrophosphokinase
MAPAPDRARNGDEVEIVRPTGRRRRPPGNRLVRARQGRAAIRRATRAPCAGNMPGLGRQILERAFERAARRFSDEKLKGALPRLARASAEDVLAAVGPGRDVLR